MEVSGSAPGWTILHSSFRSELYGILSALVLLTEVSLYCELDTTTSHTVTIYIDNQSVVDRLQRHRQQPCHLGEYMAADMDIELQVHQELEYLKRQGYIIQPIQWIKAHQDRHHPYASLSRPAQLNVLADGLASAVHTNGCFRMDYSTFTAVSAQLYLNEQPVTSKYKECIRTAFHTQDMRTYYLKKCEQWTESTIDDVWWEVYGTAIQQFSNADQQKIQKFNVRRLHTNNRAQYFDNKHTDRCAHCPQKIETNDHLIQCSECTDHRLQTKKQWLDLLPQKLAALYTPPVVNKMIVAGITNWIDKKTDRPIKEFDKHATAPLIHAYKSQQQIGWDNLLRGKLSSLWEPVVQEYYTQFHIPRTTMTTERWAKAVLLELWHGVLAIWEARNHEIHGSDNESRQQAEKQRLLLEANQLQSDGTQYNHYDVQWFQKPLAELEQYSVVALKSWVRNARTISRLHLKEQRSHQTTLHTNTIHNSNPNPLITSHSIPRSRRINRRRQNNINEPHTCNNKVNSSVSVS